MEPICPSENQAPFSWYKIFITNKNDTLLFFVELSGYVVAFWGKLDQRTVDLCLIDIRYQKLIILYYI